MASCGYGDCVSERSARLIRVAEDHLGRVAYKTTDNPYLRAAAVARLDPRAHELLVHLLDGELAQTPDAGQLADDRFGRIALGVLPRELQLLIRDEPRVGVGSVSAFVDASRFWWVVAYLWCIEVGRSVDRQIADAIFGYRLDPPFARSPGKSGRMFRRTRPIREEWSRVANATSVAHDYDVVAAATVDLRGFYYSVDAPPSRIVRTFLSGTGRRLAQRGQALTSLLDIAHQLYARDDRELAPRGDSLAQGEWPLPVGFPSSMILANLIIATVVKELEVLDSVAGLSAYADDILIVSTTLPEVDEDPDAYLRRIEVIEGDDERLFLNSHTGRTLAKLEVALEKSEIAYSRAPRPAQEEAAAGDGSASDVGFSQVTALDPYLEPAPGADWGGRLRTVLRSPFRRPRVPKELLRDFHRLEEEIAVGVDVDYAATELIRVLGDVDEAALLELRVAWPTILACAYFAGGVGATSSLLERISDAIDALELPGEMGERLQAAVEAGLRFSLAQALAEGLAVARGRNLESPGLDAGLVRRCTGESMAQIQHRVARIRDERFVSARMVSVPLAEFTSWDGPLFGHAAHAAFETWFEDEVDGDHVSSVLAALADAKRFVGLHEVSVAIHLWLAPGGSGWRTRVFEAFAAQPLLDPAGVTDLRKRARRALRAGSTDARVDDIDDYNLRFAVPSVGVSGDQLKAIVRGDAPTTSRIARAARKAVMSITRDATANRAHVLVLPEWSIPQRLLSFIFGVSARRQMLIVGGEAPYVRHHAYSNRVWTGIPLMDSWGRKFCLVPPPREKRYLAAEEKRDLATGGLVHSPPSAAIPVYEWRGICFASLICFEFADIKARDALRATADLLTVSSWNMDWRYFDAVQEATTRDNYCVTVCVNTSQFPGTHIMRPTSSEKSIALSVHGSRHPAVVTRDVDMLPVVLARASNLRPHVKNGFLEPRDDLSLDDYKALPPSF